MEKSPEWLDDFIMTSFGQYQVMNQRDFVQKIKDDQSSLNQQNTLDNRKTVKDKANFEGMNDQTGEPFEVIVDNMKEQQKKDKGLQIEFSSGKNKEKYICASIEEFCDGRYAHLKAQPSLVAIAEEIGKDNAYIINFIETSIASSSDFVTIESALNITDKIVHESSINEQDYNKITSKLNYEDLNIYNTYLAQAKIEVKKSVHNVDYYLDYIKNFKEYKIASIPELQKRISSIGKFKEIRAELEQEFKKDSILKDIEIGE